MLAGRTAMATGAPPASTVMGQLALLVADLQLPGNRQARVTSSLRPMVRPRVQRPTSSVGMRLASSTHPGPHIRRLIGFSRRLAYLLAPQRPQ